LVFAVVFLFETWVWDSLTAVMGWISRRIPWLRIKSAIKSVIDRLPAIFAVLLFGVPVIVMELGSFFSVVAIALGHVILGAICYGVLKLFGVSLIAVIYDLTREKLMTLAWFVWLHVKFERLHAWARALLAPYREAALAQIASWKQRMAESLRPHRSGLAAQRRPQRAVKPEFD
jgi:hypothetical protein